MTMPSRLQLRRTKGFRLPDGAVNVARPGKWGNPFPWKGDWIMWTAVGLGFMANEPGRRRAAVVLHRAWITRQPLALNQFREVDDRWPEGGVLEFTDGRAVAMVDHVAGIALGAAGLCDQPALPEAPSDFSELRGHDLACWCPPDGPCHADVLLEIAND